MLAGNVVITAGAAGGAGAVLVGAVVVEVGLSCLSSVELQLETPNAASIERTRIVKATRGVVQRGLVFG
jgi:hypothetical protein